MQIKHKLAISLAALLLSVVALTGATTVLAQGSPQPSFISELAQKLGVDPTKLQQALNQIKQERQAQAQTNYENRLEQAVKQGKITEAQKTAILNEEAKLKSEYNPATLKNMTPSERRQTLKQAYSEAQTWAKAQGISLKYLRVYFLGPRGKWMLMHQVQTSPTPNT